MIARKNHQPAWRSRQVPQHILDSGRGAGQVGLPLYSRQKAESRIGYSSIGSMSLVSFGRQVEIESSRGEVPKQRLEEKSMVIAKSCPYVVFVLHGRAVVNQETGGEAREEPFLDLDVF